MAKTIDAGFLLLRQNLEITDLQATTISTRQGNVRDAIKAEFDTLSDFLTGSYKRDTMIAPLKKADVDIMFALDPKYHKEFTARALLDKAKRALKKAYPNTPEISRSGQAVTITFTDFAVDVVVGFNRSGGGYLIANSITDSYLSTDPTKHVDLWTASNAKHNSMLKPLLKMLKGWNRENGDQFRSFHLEAVCRQVFESLTIASYPSAAQQFFKGAQAYIDSGLNDPAGYGDDLGRYMTQTTKDGVKSRLSTAETRASAAINYATAGKIEDAYERWRLVFGSYFPVYG